MYFTVTYYILVSLIKSYETKKVIRISPQCSKIKLNKMQKG